MLQEKILTLFPASGYRSRWMNPLFWTAILTIACAISSGWRALLLPLALPLMARTLALYVPCRPHLIFWTTILFGLMPVIRPQVIATDMDTLRLLLGTATFFTLSHSLFTRSKRPLFIASTIVLTGLLTAAAVPLLSFPPEDVLSQSPWKYPGILPSRRIFFPLDFYTEYVRNFHLKADLQPEFFRLFTLRYQSVNILLIINFFIQCWELSKKRYKFKYLLKSWIPLGVFTALYVSLAILGKKHIDYMLPVFTSIIPILFIIIAQSIAPFRILHINLRYLNNPSSFSHIIYQIPRGVWLLLILLLCAFFVLSIKENEPFPFFDTDSYTQAWDRYAQGIPDPARTPLYPIFLGVCHFCFGSHYILGITVIQVIGLIYSIFIFRRLSRRLINNDTIIFWGTAIVFFNPDLIVYSSSRMTESLSFLLVLLYTDSFVRSLQNNGTKAIWECMIWSIMMIALRPGFIWILPFEGIFWFCLIWSRRNLKIVIAIIIAIGFPTLLLGLYAHSVKSYYGLQSFSYISTLNNMATLTSMGVTTPETCNDPVLRGKLEVCYSDSVSIHSDRLSKLTSIALEQNGPKEYKWKDRFRPMDNYVDSMMKVHIMELPAFFWKRATYGTPNNSLYRFSFIIGQKFINFITPYFANINLLLIIFMIVAVWQTYKLRQRIFTRKLLCSGLVFWIPWGMFMTNYIVTIISGYFQWNRLNLPVWSLLVLTGMLLIGLLSPINLTNKCFIPKEKSPNEKPKDIQRR